MIPLPPKSTGYGVGLGTTEMGWETLKRYPGRALGDRAVLATALGATLILSSGGPALAAAAATATAAAATATAAAATATATAATGTAAAATGTAAAQTAPALPPAPFALNAHAKKGLEWALAPYTLPVNGFGTANLGSQANIDASAVPPSVLEQRTFFSALQQWQAQGARPVSANTQVVINPATAYRNVQTTGVGAKVIPAGGLAGNQQPALALPDTVESVDFPFTVAKTGLYELKFGYYDYPECFSQSGTTVASFTTNQSAATTGPYCGRGTAPERGILIDPPGTVPTVAASASTPPAVSQTILQAAKASGLSPVALPAWINPANDYVPVPAVPAWTLPPPGPSTAGSTAAQPAAASGTSATAAAGGTGAAPAPQASTTAAPGAGSVCGMNLSPSGQNLGYDGYQYQEAHQTAFPGMWQYQGTTVNPKTGYVNFTKDNRGDNLYPLPQEIEQWQSSEAYDAQGTYGSPLLFCLTAGKHVLRLQMVREPMAIQSIVFHGVPALPSYSQALATWKSEGMQPVTCGMCVEVQGENIYRMSDPTIQPGSDPYPSVVPQTKGYFILNELNGATFQQPNEWVEWKVTVPQTGLYKLGFRVLQAQLQGLPATRRLSIDGSMPFNGAQWISIPFKNSWNMVTLAQPNGSPALIGLTKGTHVIRLSTTLGLVGQALAVIQQTDQRLGELQREILMITGPTPNPQVDYNLPQNVVDLIPQMQSIVSALRQQAAILTYDAGGTPPVSANSLDITANDIQKMSEHPDQIQLDMSEWGQDETALAQWITLLEAQPVSIDWIGLAAPAYRFPSPQAGLWTQFKVTWDNFILSFYRDYTGVGSVYTNAINVWVGFGQSWAAVMSEMANSEFTPATGIHVNFNVVPGGAGIVLLAQVSGHGPDVATGMPATTPVDFALRGGAVDLSTMPNWSTIAKRFVPQATLPYQYRNAAGKIGTYGLPETQGMTMILYRKDILQSLVPGGIQPPKTWQELYAIIPILTAHGMEFLYPAAPQGFLPFLYQNGGSYYTNSPQGIKSNLNTSNAYAAFKAWTNLFLQWNVPVSANFFTRFQTGEVPLAIGAYNDYVTLQAGAPQLQGLWGIAPIPATAYLCTNANDPSTCTVDTHQDTCTMPDFPAQPAIPAGDTCKYNDTSGDMGASTAVVIPKSSKHPQQAWQFIEWWTSTATQLEFASDIEAIGGIQLAWNTANVQALAGLPWPEQDLRVFQQIWKSYTPEPIVPGGYLSDRYVNNIWTNVVINGQNPRAQLQWAAQNVNDELYRQEVQFGLTQNKGFVAVGG